jgi:GntR family transcriptional regulator
MKPGSAMPSVRDLARDLSINPATVAKGYQRLVDAGILAVKRGEGTFVAQKPPALPRGEREKELEGGAMRYASLAVTIGAAPDEAVERVRHALGDLLRKKIGGPA